MKLTPLNQDIKNLLGPDGYPSDWRNDDLAFWGLSRHEANRHYVVKLAVGGVQHFLGNAYSKRMGARLYDYALWKFAGKMSRDGHINFPEDFAFITQADIDRDAPRLNELYLKIPFLKLSDELLPEHQLRDQRLANGFRAVEKAESVVKDFYLTQLSRLKRLRVVATQAFISVSEGRLKLGLQKLPEIDNQFRAVEQAIANLSKNLLELETAMEGQHAYYRKMKYESSHEGFYK